MFLNVITCNTLDAVTWRSIQSYIAINYLKTSNKLRKQKLNSIVYHTNEWHVTASEVPRVIMLKNVIFNDNLTIWHVACCGTIWYVYITKHKISRMSICCMQTCCVPSKDSYVNRNQCHPTASNRKWIKIVHYIIFYRNLAL